MALVVVVGGREELQLVHGLHTSQSMIQHTVLIIVHVFRSRKHTEIGKLYERGRGLVVLQ